MSEHVLQELVVFLRKLSKAPAGASREMANRQRKYARAADVIEQARDYTCGKCGQPMVTLLYDWRGKPADAQLATGQCAGCQDSPNESET